MIWDGKRKHIWRDDNGQIRVSAWLRRRAIGLVVVYGLLLAIVDVPLWQPGAYITPGANIQVAEAQRWLLGHLSLANRDFYDTAPVGDEVFSHFPPLMTFLSLAVVPWSPDGVPMILASAIFVLPVPLLAFMLFLRRSPTVVCAVVLTCLFVLGTSEYSVLRRVLQSGKVWQMNNAITQVGLLLFLLEFFGRRRVWVGGVGLLISIWARLTMGVYLLPFWWMILKGGTESSSTDAVRTRRIVAGALLTVVILGVPMLLNTLKFGNPLNTGYTLIYADRDDPVARTAQYTGVFSPVYIPRNLYWMNLGLPTIEKYRGDWRWVASTECTGLLWTTPVVLFLFWDWRRIWSERSNRWLLASVGIVYVVLMLYHNTGWTQKGYNRFSLDFLLPLLAMVAPMAMMGRRKYLTVGLTIWSIVYFCGIVPWATTTSKVTW